MASTDNNEVLILGSGTLAEELASSFRRLGYVVRVGSLSGDAALAAGTPALTVVCESAPSEKLAELEATTGTRLVPTVEACEITRNREGIRRTAAEEHGLPTMAYEFADSPGELRTCAERVGYPCVVKPGTSTGGEGQSVVTGPAELDEAWRKASTSGEEGRVGVERYVDFDFECTILAARSIDPETGQLATWFCEPIGTHHEDGHLVEVWQPAPLSADAMDNARSIAARITNAIGVQGIYAIDLFVDGDEVYFSQVSARPTLDGMVTGATQRVNEFDLHARAVLGLPIDVTLTSPGAARFVSAPASHTGLADALAVPETGVEVAGDTVVVRSTGENVAEARERAREAAARLG
ncbi:ATP-grasp domain-containing protein [Corynebacterium timonense]|uniref:Formate-dependent phosphoribosylglycinamide formyltransferase n=1 Tax=Corynebacterium timonense TaxID=441500 RepID=A0A1H1VJY8_9CORY|nr:ATP-grasp domain-containing protein [Corynebacterium timonense]SDS85274.1 formate-dependent phosphoribosylglycinamide formyltransferase [Corynebacterium timonense]